MYAIQLDLFTPPEKVESEYITKSLSVISDKQDRQRRAFFGALGKVGKEQNAINEELYKLRAELSAIRKQLELVAQNN